MALGYNHSFPFISAASDPSGSNDSIPWPAWVPLPILLVLMLALWRAGLTGSYSLPFVQIVLYFFCSTLAGLAIAVLVGRAFAEHKQLGLLLVGCGALFWGAAGLTSVVATIYHGTATIDLNTQVTIHNLCVFLSAWCHLGGLAITLRWNSTCLRWRTWITCAYLFTFLLVTAIVIAAHAHAFPPFFIQGSGGTLVRQIILFTSIDILLISALLMTGMQRWRHSRFLQWYTLAMLFLACGLFGVMIQSVHSSLLGWTGRLAQWLGGIYLFLASLVARHDKETGIDLHSTACSRHCRCGVVVALVLTACVLRLLFLDNLEGRGIYVTFYPAIIFSALYGGRSTGFMATTLSALLALYFFVPPAHQLSIKTSHDIISLGIFMLNGTLLSWVTDAMQRAQERAVIAESEAALAAERLATSLAIEEHNQQLEQRVLERTGELKMTVAQLEQEIISRSFAEKELRHSEEVLQLAAQLAGIGTFDYYPQTGRMECSSIYRQQIGLGKDVPVDYETFCETIHPEDREHVLHMLHAAFKGRNAGEFRLDFRCIGREDGIERWVSQHGQTFFNSSGTAVRFIGVSRDFTRELEETDRRLEAEHALRLESEERLKAVEALRSKEQLLIHQSRQAAMGEMIGNIAHQWRQPLNTLGLSIQQLLLFYDLGAFDRNFLAETTDSSMQLIQHMSQTIDDFRNYFCPEKEKVLFRVQDSVARTVSLLSGSLDNSNITLQINAEADPLVHGHPNEFAQALLNIISNARDALLERRTGDPRVQITIGGSDERAVIRIADNAGGIPEEIIGRIFDPYFTTKGPQSGTGVGLFMSRTIIETNMGGTLTVRNGEQGAEFIIEV